MTAANLIVNSTDVLVIDKAESNLGTDGYSCFNPAMHGSYLGTISGCGAKDYAQEGMLIMSTSVGHEHDVLMKRPRLLGGTLR